MDILKEKDVNKRSLLVCVLFFCFSFVFQIVLLLHIVNAHNIVSPLWNERAVFMLTASLAAMGRMKYDKEIISLSHK